MIRDFAGKGPILGICLESQAIAEVFGGKLGLAPKSHAWETEQYQL